MSTSSSAIGAFLSFSALSIYRTSLTTPLEGITKREILSESPTTTVKVIRSTPFIDLWKGLQPNSLRTFTKTYTQIASFKVASWSVPTQLDPGVRGILIGTLSSGLEAGVTNAWNVLITRFIQGQGWGVIKQEGPRLLSKGFIPAFIHRSSSGSIFFGVYEKLNQVYPNHPAWSGVCAGLVQVTLTSPFYITTVLRQGKNPPSERLVPLIFKIGKTQGWMRGLVFRGLIPRSIQSVATSAPLMILLEKYGILHR